MKLLMKKLRNQHHNKKKLTKEPKKGQEKWWVKLSLKLIKKRKRRTLTISPTLNTWKRRELNNKT